MNNIYKLGIDFDTYNTRNIDFMGVCDYVSTLKSLGIRHIDFYLDDNIFQKRTIDILRFCNGIGISIGFHAVTIEGCYTNNDTFESTYDAISVHLKYMKKIRELFDQIGIPGEILINYHVGEIEEFQIQFFKELVVHGDYYHVKVLVENTPLYYQNTEGYANGIAGAENILSKVEGLGFCWDLGHSFRDHVLSGKRRFVEPFAAELTRYTHIHQWSESSSRDHSPLKTKDLLSEVIYLMKHGFHGPFALELDFTISSFDETFRCVRFLDQICKEAQEKIAE